MNSTNYTLSICYFSRILMALSIIRMATEARAKRKSLYNVQSTVTQFLQLERLMCTVCALGTNIINERRSSKFAVISKSFENGKRKRHALPLHAQNFYQRFFICIEREAER